MEFQLASDSDLDDEIITPIGGSPHGSLRGQMLESDSPSDFVKKTVPPRRKADQLRKKGQPSRNLQRPKTSVSRNVLSSLKNDDSVELSKEDMRGIYAELQAINDKLREENRILHEREINLKDRERMLSISQESLQTVTEHQVKVKMIAIEQKYKAELVALEQALKEKTKENKRLKENFEAIKQANDVLKKEMEVLKTQNAKLTKSSSSLQARLANLQRKAEYDQKLKDSDMVKIQLNAIADKTQKDTTKPQKEKEEKEYKEGAKPAKSTSQSPAQVYTGTLSILLDWVCEAHLRQTVSELPTKPSETFSSPSFINERAIKILPSLVDILRDNSSSVRCCLPCLQFIYWSLLHFDQMQNQTNVIMSTTTRRLGEEIFYPKGSKVTEIDKLIGPVGDKGKEGLFLRSGNHHIRFLSALIVLKTLSRADVVAHAFDVLKTDLKNDQVKELFLFYQATGVITFFMKPVNKTFIPAAVDIMLQMSAESAFQKLFLESCSNETWFRTAAMLIRTPLPDIKILERLSIILQKLTKIKSNKRYFEVYTIVTIIQEMLLEGGNENSFLTLNLRSILFNLNMGSKT